MAATGVPIVEYGIAHGYCDTPVVVLGPLDGLPPAIQVRLDIVKQ
jgi:hypothetical protein